MTQYDGRGPVESPGVVPPPRPSASVLTLVSLWRLVLAGVAFTGFFAALTSDFDADVRLFNINYFSQLSCLAVGLSAVGGLLSPLWNAGALEGRRGFVRGATATWSMLTLLVFATLLAADYDSLSSKIEHLIVPVLALVDWLAVGRNQRTLQWWWPVAWLLGPAIYLPFYISASHTRGRALYPFLDPDKANFVGVSAGLMVGFLVLGFVYWGIGKLRGLVVLAR